MGSKTHDRGDPPVPHGWDGPPMESTRRSSPERRATMDPIESTAVYKDKLFKVLGNRRRRHVLHYLEWVDRPVRLDELAERIAAWENGTSIEGIGSAERKRVYTALQQFHLPKLDDAELIAYDERAGVIERTRIAEDLDVYLDLVPDNDVPWSYYYLGTTLTGLVLAVLSGAGAIPFSFVPPVGWTAVFLLIVLGSAAVHAYRDRRLRVGATEQPPEIDTE
ncbi:DUF7344 domain-containing protein [Halovivax gelatinilyticus]|uniref:DUF7344 domain-containing protein n=1 Tax=Halovivax gelatinilyticus TaxID=2961597 RepID=UPI0020CA9650|nr:hypothetical protein [Halovivax gelatinilyticus]